MKKVFFIILIFALPFFVFSNVAVDLTSGLVVYYLFNGNAKMDRGMGIMGQFMELSSHLTDLDFK